MSSAIHKAQEFSDSSALRIQLANRIEEDNKQSNFLHAAEYDDFREFLSDVWMSHDEFLECWDKFQEWLDRTPTNNK